MTVRDEQQKLRHAHREWKRWGRDNWRRSRPPGIREPEVEAFVAFACSLYCASDETED